MQKVKLDFEAQKPGPKTTLRTCDQGGPDQGLIGPQTMPRDLTLVSRAKKLGLSTCVRQSLTMIFKAQNWALQPMVRESLTMVSRAPKSGLRIYIKGVPYHGF